jgi:nitrous oxide reductase accessory protein NosL
MPSSRLTRPAALLVVLAALALAACSEEPATGPVSIRFGRDVCDFCGMVITDPRFAAQIRGGPGHKAHKFDDLGEGLVFLSIQPWSGDDDVEIWVMDMTSGRTWLDARKSYFVKVGQSPMGFNYGAVEAPAAGALDFEAYRKLALASPAAQLCIGGVRAGARAAP